MLLTKKSRLTALFLLMVGALVLPALLGPRQAAAQDNSWRARYWNNRNLSGDPVLRRDEANIDHDWGGDGPGSPVPDDNFSARWTRDVDFAAGNYRFSATMDDGMRVWIDDQLIIDSWTDSQVHTVSADRYLSGGRHSVRVEYFEAGGVAVAKFGWAPIGGNQPSVFTGWRGEYFNNPNLSGNPAAVRDDPSINFDWGGGAPIGGVGSDQFSVRWTRLIDFPAGSYRFDVFSDDGIRLWVNNVLVIDQWRDQSDGRFSANVNLAGGAVPVRVEYYENAGRAAVSLSWNPPLGTAVQPGTGGQTQFAYWRGEYFANMNLSGSPTAVRDDGTINFDWGTGSPLPGIPADQFSVRWTRTIDFPAGAYTFEVFSDDGARLWVNNQMVVDQWRDQSDGRTFATVSLPGGAIPVRLEYYENTGRAAVSLSWNPPLGTSVPSTPPPAIPPEAPPPGTPAAIMNKALYLNVRAAPSIDAEVVDHLSRNQIVPLTGYQSPGGFWLEIRLPSGQTGWASTSYLTSNVNTTTFPVKSQ